jgi:formate C-acetyltransferase
VLELLDPLRARIHAGDNTHGFTERQRLLADLAPGIEKIPLEERYATVLATLLSGVSTPIEADDVILGRVVEGPLGSGSEWHPNLPGFSSYGHITPDYPTLLEKGLRRIAQEARETAERVGDQEARWFADSTSCCCEAVVSYAERYAQAALRVARSSGGPGRERLERAAVALQAAPAGPAPDFFSALQGIWVFHLVLSCYVGARDFAFGRIDQYLLPLYQRGLADGTLSRDLARAYLAHFLIKTKEITGTATDNHRPKPVPSFASNQYLVIGGRAADGHDESNALSSLFLEAACLAKVPQPGINVRLHRGTGRELKAAAAGALPTCQHQIQFWNDERTIPALQSLGVPCADASGYDLTACNRVSLPGALDWRSCDAFHNLAHWLLLALGAGQDPLTGQCAVEAIPGPAELLSLEDVLGAYAKVVRQVLARSVVERSAWMQGDPREFQLESVLLQDCVARGRGYASGGLSRRAQFHFFGGVATAANSLAAIHHLVFKQRRFELPRFLRIVADNFAGHEDLRQEILHRVPKFGNDEEDVDRLARRLCTIALDALAAAPNPHGHLLLPSIYSLYCHIAWGQALPATPDGRRRGEPVSENQSPTYGTDTAGITALLHSVARLPLERTPAGGLNVKLASAPDPQAVLQLTESFFELGGVHVGYTFVSAKDLLAAQLHPAEYRTLCVRVTGFSEYFLALAPEHQAAIIARTEY